VAGALSWEGIEYFTRPTLIEPLKTPISGVTETVAMYVRKPADMSAGDLLDKSFEATGAEGVIVKRPMFPLHVEMVCPNEKRCKLDVPTKDEFPNENVKCDCDEKFWLVKVENITEAPGTNAFNVEGRDEGK
jgi:hypothetical protein